VLSLIDPFGALVPVILIPSLATFWPGHADQVANDREVLGVCEQDAL